VDLGQLIAQVDHGPGGGMAVVHLAMVGILVLAGLAFVLLRRDRRGSDPDAPPMPDHDPERDRGPET
jgi:hypothetical protein